MMFVEKKCHCCGKVFFPTQHHVYKEMYNGHMKWFDKYTCMLRYRENNKDKERSRQ